MVLNKKASRPIQVSEPADANHQVGALRHGNRNVMGNETAQVPARTAKDERHRATMAPVTMTR